MSKGAKRLLLDTSSLMYRAFFAVPQSVADPEGRPVNAVYGYLDMTARLVASRRPDDVVHVYDADWRPAARVQLYEGYKADRRPEPEPLSDQFDLLAEVLDALGALQAEAPGWEAEDAIGALCAAGGIGFAAADSRETAVRFEIVTGDRDLIQLVRDPDVRVLFTVRGVSELRELDEAGVLERYGIPAGRYADFAILRGDASDGLPGVKGVGEKTARWLVQRYPSLDALVAEALTPAGVGGPLPPGIRSCLRSSVDYLKAMAQVVPIRTDVEVRTWGGPPSDERLEELAERHGLKGPIQRLRKALGAGA